MTRLVRNATLADVSELAAVAAVTFPLACPPSTTSEAISSFVAANLMPANFTNYLAADDRLLLVLVEEGSVIGYSMLVAGAPYDDEVAAQLRILPSIELSKFYLLPDEHGTGAAGLLMRATLDAAGPFGEASGIWLGTNQQNVRAQRFYEKHGFERVGVKRFLVGDRYEDDFVFERPLEASTPAYRTELSGR